MSLETMSGAAIAARSAPSASTMPAAVAATATLPKHVLPLGLRSTTVSDEMRSLLDGQKKLHDQILKLQTQIEEEEAVYLEETSHGNIIRGWDGFIDSKQSRKDAALKKIKPYTETEHLFSSCCSYSTLANEPSIDLVDYYAKEGTTRRKVIAAAALSSSGLSSTSSGTTIGRLSASPSPHPLGGLERKSSFSSGRAASGSTGGAPLGRPPKIKKRRRLEHLEFASTASATQSETGEDDDKETTSMTKKKSRAMSTGLEPTPSATGTPNSGGDNGDFVDML